MSVELCFFDLEGTLFSSVEVQTNDGDSRVLTNLWTLLMHELGEAAVREEQRSTERWERGEYRGYLDWVRDSAGTLKQHGLTRDQYRRAVQKIPFNEGVEETFRVLNDRGVRTAVISGGFMNHARQAQRRLKITHAFAAIDLLWDEDGALEHWNILPSDYEGKIDFVRLLEREYGLPPEDCMFVGDGENDVHIAREVGLSFAYNAHPKLRREADHVLEDFRDLIDYLPG